MEKYFSEERCFVALNILVYVNSLILLLYTSNLSFKTAVLCKPKKCNYFEDIIDIESIVIDMRIKNLTSSKKGLKEKEAMRYRC